MSKKNTRILAIDPGLKEMGIALLDGGKLFYHGVKVIGQRDMTPQKKLKVGRKIILRLIEDFKPQVLAVERAFFGRSLKSSIINTFVRDIEDLGRRKRLQVISYASVTVRKYICGDGRANKAELSRAVVSRYPELKVYLTQDRAWKERYHQNMFDAVALGMMAFASETGRLRVKKG